MRCSAPTRKKKGEGEALTFTLCMQVGLGQLRFSPAVFYDMLFEEFIAAWRGMNDREEMRQRQEWERTRWAATVALAPHGKQGQRIKPQDLCIFPWESKPNKKGSNKMLAHVLKGMADG